MSAPHDLHLWRGGVTIRSPRSVLLLSPYQLPVVTCLFAVTVVFTFWPEALEHTPLSFEARGAIHHVWHYAALAASLLTLVGMFSAQRWRLKAELIGLIGLIGVVGVNLVAFVAASTVETPNGLDLAFRLGILLGFTVRAVTLVREPTVDLRETTPTVGG